MKAHKAVFVINLRHMGICAEGGMQIVRIVCVQTQDVVSSSHRNRLEQFSHVYFVDLCSSH